MTRKFAFALAPWIFTGPALLFAVVFLYLPVVFSVGLSVTDWNFIRPEANFVGLENYRRIFADPNFRDALINTLIYCVVLIPAQILVPLGLAVLLIRVRQGTVANGYKIALFLPTILAYSTAGIAWLWLFDPLNGFFNTALGWVGLPPQRWHTDPDLALWCVTIVAFWKNFGLNMLLFLAALVSIPKPILEAAALDGARPFWRFLTIELPLISPTFFFVAVTTTMGVLDDIVGAIDVLTGGGPYGQSSNILHYMYQRGLQFFQFGQASAAAVLIILLILAVTWLQFRMFEHRVHYES
ncbi:carbohydrate ABC transporter permease [Pseudoruegeria sp. HB172150]|uniref:carbohydrate ABC transporter permease n=1 Tax=Pseudoruegeria sp. HB172150 TaxID=2721164 RepID=UPI001554C0C7|nr:sugar ABC transporter permease [Pseudoruegeria sp. HB172150]